MRRTDNCFVVYFIIIIIVVVVVSFYFGLLLVQSWIKVCREIHEIKQNRFFYEMFYS